jgi:ABC-type dipeptide/oligopeptide/nickel transport system permease component
VRVLRYTVRRVLMSVPVLLGVTLVTFLTTRALPGNPVDRITNALVSSDEMRQELLKRYGYDKPVYVQYFSYLKQIAHGDLGLSFITGHNVYDDIRQRVIPTLELTTFALLVAVGLGIPLGLLAGLKQNSVIDHAVRVISVFGVAAPAFWLAMLLVFVFFYKLHWVGPPMGRLPVSVAPPAHITGFYTIDSLLTGNWPALIGSVRVLILPVLTLGLEALAPIARMTRAEALEVLSSSYVQTARALGLSYRTTLRHHVLKNTLLPVITLIGVILGYLLGGVVVTETVFSWPGLGLYAFNAAAGADHPAVQGFVLYVTAAYVLVFLVLDIVYAFLDPRIRS